MNNGPRGTGRAAVRSAVGAFTNLWRRPRVVARLGREGGLSGSAAPLDREAEELLALGRESAFLAAVTAPGTRVDAHAIGEGLVALGALAAAAAFVQRCPPNLAGVSAVRAAAQDAARAAVKTVSLRGEPCAYADAALALARLQPDATAPGELTARSASRLTDLAGAASRAGDVDDALTALTWAARLRPDDRALLGSLAEAAARAGDGWRHAETVRRIGVLELDPASLASRVEEAFAAERWEALADGLDRARRAADASAAAQIVIEAHRPDLSARFFRLAAEGDWPGALGLAGALAGWLAPPPWSADALAPLIATARRRLRDARALADPAVWPVLDFILRLAPGDVDMARLAGRNGLRRKRLREAVRRFSQVVRIDPHGARDWLDLASAHDRLGEARDRDVCLARAVAIDPASLPEPMSEAFWARMAAA